MLLDYETLKVIWWVLIGVLLIVGRWMRVATVVCSLLLLLFFGLMVRAHLKGMEINCGCFGNNEKLGTLTLLRDSSLLLLALAVTAGAFLVRRPRRVTV